LAESSAAQKGTRGSFNILTLVNQFSGHGCSDDRDRVYALYAMASNIEPAPSRPSSNEVLRPSQGETEVEDKKALKKDLVYMNVDYTLNVRDTYITFADAYLKASMTLGLLGAAVTRLHDRKPNMWPSWLPD
jgi:hypothetical protein